MKETVTLTKKELAEAVASAVADLINKKEENGLNSDGKLAIVLSGGIISAQMVRNLFCEDKGEDKDDKEDNKDEI